MSPGHKKTAIEAQGRNDNGNPCILRIQKNPASVLARSFSLFFSPLSASLVFNKTNHLHKAVLRIATLKFTEVAVFELVIMIIDIRIKFFA